MNEEEYKDILDVIAPKTRDRYYYIGRKPFYSSFICDNLEFIGLILIGFADYQKIRLSPYFH